MPSQSTLDRIPAIERLASVVGALALMVIVTGPLAGLIVALRQEWDPELGVERRRDVGTGIGLTVTSLVVGFTMLLQTTYIQHRLILDARAASATDAAPRSN